MGQYMTYSFVFCSPIWFRATRAAAYLVLAILESFNG